MTAPETRRQIADIIARELLASLKAGELKVIGIDQIRLAIKRRVPTVRFGSTEYEKIEEATTRRLVMLV